MILNGVDRGLILSLICGDQPQSGNEVVAPTSDDRSVELEASHVSGTIIHETLEALRSSGLDVALITNTFGDLYRSENHDAAYLLLVLCYMVSEVELPKAALPPLSHYYAVEAEISNAYLDMNEYLEDLENEGDASKDTSATGKRHD